MQRPPIENILTVYKENYSGPWDLGLVAKLHTEELAQYALLLEKALELACKGEQCCSCAKDCSECTNYFIQKAGEPNGQIP